MLTCEVLSTPQVMPGYSYGTFTLDESHYLGN